MPADKKSGLHISITVPPRKCAHCGGRIPQGSHSDLCPSCEEKENKKRG